MYGHKDIFLFKVSDPLKTQTTFDQRKEVIVVKYSEIQNGKVFRFLQNKHHTHLLAYSKY